MLLISWRAHEHDNFVVDGGFQEVELVLDPGEVAFHGVEVGRGHCGQVSVHL